MEYDVRLVKDCRNCHGEGPVWIPKNGTLLWTDIEKPALCRYREISDEYESIPLERKLGSFALINERTILAAFDDLIAVFDIEDRKILHSVPIETEIPETRMNDGRADRQGHFIISGFDDEGKGRSGVYRIGKNLSIDKWFEGISSGNSICFSPDGKRMYFADTPEGVIWRYDYDAENGRIGDKTAFFDFTDEPGLPDGSVVDSEGYLWNAEWGGGRIIRISPEGKLDSVVEMPVKNPTCIAFGGNDLKTLYITTSRLMLSDEELAAQESAGSLYSISLETAGLLDGVYAL